MQGTTRSVKAVEGVVVAKAMASGGPVPLSAIAGVKSSAVVHVGGGGRSNKRKGFPGGHSSLSSTLGQKKKLCSSSSSTNEMAEVTKAAAAQSSSSSGFFATKKKTTIDESTVGDPSLEDAARALTELCSLSHRLVQSSPTPSPSPYPPNFRPKPTIAALPQWNKTKLRSGRTKRPEGSSNEHSHVAVYSDSSNPSPLPLEKEQAPLVQVLESSCSPGGDSQSVITLVKVEDNGLCGSRMGDEEEQVEQKEAEVVVVVEKQVEKNANRFPEDSGRLPKLASVSSIESLEPDSRALSPVSPLPTVLRTGELASIVPKFESSSPTGQSSFQRAAPVRPVKKPASSRKLKAEVRTFEDLNPEQAEVKHVSRKKPRPTGFVPTPPQQLEQEQEQSQQQAPRQHLAPLKLLLPSQQLPPLQHLAPVKIEEGDVCALVLGPPRISAAEEAEIKRIGETNGIAPRAAVAVSEETLKLDLAVVTVETKSPGRLAQRGGGGGGKAKATMSESEKEARKQRRVQANRESARLTIRKKQVLCEELTRKADFLSAENAAFREEVARFREKNKSISEMNTKILEQVAKSNCKREARSTSPQPSSKEKPPDTFQYHIPQYGGMPVVPPYIWAYFMAQAAYSVGLQPSEVKIGCPESAALFAAATSQAGFWGISGSQGKPSMFPPFYPGHMAGPSSATNALPSSSGKPATVSAITRSISLPVATSGGSFAPSAADSERPSPSAKLALSYRSGDFSDSVHVPHDLKRSATRQDSAHLGSGFIGRTHYFQMPSGSQTGTAVAGVDTRATRKAGEGSRVPMPSVQLLGRSRSLSTPTQISKLHSSYPVFGAAGMATQQQQLSSARESEAQRKGAAAAEARRKRIELKRTKSLWSRQQARVAEPSAS